MDACKSVQINKIRAAAIRQPPLIYTFLSANSAAIPCHGAVCSMLSTV